jgi:CSLREA domain-containing protein
MRRLTMRSLGLLVLGALPLVLAAPASAALINVTTTSDVIANDGLCSLREAVIAANTNTASGLAPGECAAGDSDVVDVDIISVPAGLYTLTIAGVLEDASLQGGLDVAAGSTIVIEGAGAGSNPAVNTIIQACTAPQTGDDACGTGVLSGETGVETGVFHVLGGGNLTLQDLTVRHGRMTPATGASGGGVVATVGSSLTITRSVVTRNLAVNGGGVAAGGTLTITDSTISENVGSIFGGGIRAEGGLTLLRSTVSENSNPSGIGGGIFIATAAATIANTTISGNSAVNGGGVQILSGTGHALVNVTIAANTIGGISGIGLRLGAAGFNPSVTLTNTLIAENTDVGADCTVTDGTLTGGHNVLEGGDCGGIVNGAGGNVTGVPGLLDATLADNGGPTRTHALLTGSPALAAGDATACADAATVDNVDQRGLTRPQGVACDVGAYEALRLSIAGLSQNEGNAGSTAFQFPVTLSAAVPLDFPSVTVQYATSAGGSNPATPGVDYTAVVPTTLTFDPGNLSKNATVFVSGDVSVESDETFLVTLTNAVGAVIATAQATGTILNDDIPHLVVSAPASAFLGTSVDFTVTARDAADALVTGYAGTVQFTSTDPLASLPAPASVTNGTGTFPVTFGTLGNQSLTATDSLDPAITGTSGLVAVSPVTSISGPSPTGTGQITATIAGGGPGCTISDSQFLPPPPGAPPVPPTTPDPKITFPHGLFAFTATGCTQGAALTVTLTYPEPLIGLVYWKFGPTAADPSPHWYVLPATIAGNTVTFSVTDGGLGDADLAANGTIVDPGGVGTTTAVPTLSDAMLLVLVLLLLADGARRLARRPRGQAFTSVHFGG